MMTQLKLGDIVLDVVQKDIRNVHLSVHPPNGRVTVAAPLRMKPDTIRVFAISKLAWIKQQQKKFREQERETPREFLDRESHYVWGKRYLLTLKEAEQSPRVELTPRRLVMTVRSGTSPEKRAEILEAWYRDQLREAIPEIIARWEPVIGVKVSRFFIQRMKTKWGSCTPASRNIRLNTDLARKPRECLEYIVVHEMVHLRESTHNERFVTLMNQFYPSWKQARQILNRLPVRHEAWGY
jgi:predicted metal-dependent hydrolase